MAIFWRQVLVQKGLVPTKGDVFRRSWGVCFVQDLLVGC